MISHPATELERALLAAPSPTDNKYSRGSVGFITGSEKYPGAALLGIGAAFELGVGMVSYLGPKSVTDLVLGNRPEVIPGLQRASVLVVGSGVEPDAESSQAREIAKHAYQNQPLVIDAGALFLVDYKRVSPLSIITPHFVEAHKLLKQFGITKSALEVSAQPEQVSVQLAKLTGCVTLLKGNITYVASPSGMLSGSLPGSVYLATAGTGDVLAGMIGTLTSRAISKNYKLTQDIVVEIALIANRVHSRAAEIAAARGEFGASAVAAAISEAVCE